MKNTKNTIKETLSSQSLCVLSTQNNGQPYSNLIAFVATDDLKYIIFATTRNTRKFNNLTLDPRVSVMIDNRTNKISDFYEAIAVTGTGTAIEVHGNEKENLLKLYLKKHNYLRNFVQVPTCALLKVKIATYYVVSSFQNVMELHIIE